VVITGRYQVMIIAAAEELGTTNALAVQTDASDPKKR
jgi:hypothetical protein